MHKILLTQRKTHDFEHHQAAYMYAYKEQEENTIDSAVCFSWLHHVSRNFNCPECPLAEAAAKPSAELLLFQRSNTSKVQQMDCESGGLTQA